MIEKRIKESASKIEDILNGNNFKAIDIGQALARYAHPTLQQTFMRMVIGFVKEQAISGHPDARNQETVNECKKIWAMWEKIEPCMPFI